MGEGSQDSQSWQARWIFRSFNNFSWHSDLVLRTGNFSKRGGSFFFFLLYKTMTIYPLAFSSLFVHKTAKVCSGKTHFIPQIHDALIIYHGTLQWQDTSFMKPCIRINPAYPQWHLALLRAHLTTKYLRPFKTPLNVQTHKRHHCTKWAISHSHLRVNWLIWCS